MRALRRPIDDVWLVLAVALPALGALLAPLSTVDVAYQVRTGDLILSAGALPRVDPFTFSAAGTEWVVQQWGAAVALALAYRPAGWAGLLVLRAILVAATFGLVLFAARRSGASARTASLLALAAFVVALPALGLRAQLLGVLCFAAVLALVAARRHSPRALYLAPLILLAWANVHGSFPLGLAALGWALLEDAVAARGRDPSAVAGRSAIVRDGTVLLLAALATLVNPYGPGLWLYAAGLVSDPAVTGLASEWQPTAITSGGGAVFYASAFGAALLVGRRRDRTSWPTKLWLLALFVLGAASGRGVVWWAIGAAVAVAPLLAPRTGAAGPTVTDAAVPKAVSAGPVPRRSSVLNGVFVLVLGAAPIVAGLALLARPGDPLTGPPGLLADAPPGLTTAVRDAVRPGDRIFNAQRWGSWLEWSVPQALVFTDSRFEVVPESAWSDHLAISAGRFDWSAALDRIGADMIVAARDEQAGLLAALAADPSSGWRVVYADADGSVFTR
jgi:hypothetical protein